MAEESNGTITWQGGSFCLTIRCQCEEVIEQSIEDNREAAFDLTCPNCGTRYALGIRLDKPMGSRAYWFRQRITAHPVEAADYKLEPVRGEAWCHGPA